MEDLKGDRKLQDVKKLPNRAQCVERGIDVARGSEAFSQNKQGWMTGTLKACRIMCNYLGITQDCVARSEWKDTEAILGMARNLLKRCLREKKVNHRSYEQMLAVLSDPDRMIAYEWSDESAFQKECFLVGDSVLHQTRGTESDPLTENIPKAVNETKTKISERADKCFAANCEIPFSQIKCKVEGGQTCAVLNETLHKMIDANWTESDSYQTPENFEGYVAYQWAANDVCSKYDAYSKKSNATKEISLNETQITAVRQTAALFKRVERGHIGGLGSGEIWGIPAPFDEYLDYCVDILLTSDKMIINNEKQLDQIERAPGDR